MSNTTQQLAAWIQAIASASTNQLFELAELAQVSLDLQTDFRNQDLGGIDLTGLSLSRADFTDSNLQGAILIGADLSQAKFDRANLAGADLSQANLERASLRGARLDRAICVNTNLDGANLSQTNLIETNLSEANLSHALLVAANLSLANLTGSKLEEVNVLNALFYQSQGLTPTVENKLQQQEAFFRLDEAKDHHSNLSSLASKQLQPQPIVIVNQMHISSQVLEINRSLGYLKVKGLNSRKLPPTKLQQGWLIPVIQASTRTLTLLLLDQFLKITNTIKIDIPSDCNSVESVTSNKNASCIAVIYNKLGSSKLNPPGHIRGRLLLVYDRESNQLLKKDNIISDRCHIDMLGRLWVIVSGQWQDFKGTSYDPICGDDDDDLDDLDCYEDEYLEYLAKLIVLDIATGDYLAEAPANFETEIAFDRDMIDFTLLGTPVENVVLIQSIYQETDVEPVIIKVILEQDHLRLAAAEFLGWIDMFGSLDFFAVNGSAFISSEYVTSSDGSFRNQQLTLRDLDKCRKVQSFEFENFLPRSPWQGSVTGFLSENVILVCDDEDIPFLVDTKNNLVMGSIQLKLPGVNIGQRVDYFQRQSQDAMIFIIGEHLVLVDIADLADRVCSKSAI